MPPSKKKLSAGKRTAGKSSFDRASVARSSPRKTVKSGKAAKSTPNTDPLDASIGYSLRRAQLSTYENFNSFMEKFQVRPSQYAALVLIRSNPGLKQSAISLALGIQKANFVTLLDRLEERGLTERRKVGGDRRSSALHLTATGESFVRKIEAGHALHEARLVSRLGTNRSRELLELLHQFLKKAR